MFVIRGLSDRFGLPRLLLPTQQSVAGNTDPNPFGNPYPCQGPYPECVGMTKEDARAYIKERMEYCGDNTTKVFLYEKGAGSPNRVFVHVNSVGTVTKLSAA